MLDVGAPDTDGPDTDWLEYVDRSTGVYRAAHVIDERIEACVFLSPRPDLPSRTWLASLFAKPALDAHDREGLLLGRPAGPNGDAGGIVCSCFGVGRNTIRAGIRQRSLTTALQIGEHFRAGTNCGSCLPELKAILAAERAGISVD